MLRFITIATPLVPYPIKVPRVAVGKAETVTADISYASNGRRIALSAAKAAHSEETRE
jgi:hypothetical protein